MDKKPLIDFILSNIKNIIIMPESLGIISEKFDKIEIKKNEFLLKEGKVSGYLYLNDGFMRAYTYDADGDEVTTNFFDKGRVVFEVASFFMQLPSTENIQAITDCEGYYTTFEKLNTLFHAVPEFREFGRLMLVKEFVSYKQRNLAMINKNADERYAHILKTNPEIFQYAQLKYIASYLGISERSLSRTRTELAKR